ncbi:hypothetical protein AB0H83_01945 [Dactylosporangium sp. NPDC050688]|uniref:hypothetical protein n=1 Tax=Dactylosporangium sp. NPDC050688 TaxID=3157217 RepID=UPI0033FCFA9E
MAESYRRWRLPELWEMVAADDAVDAHLHLATLRRQQIALEVHRDRLRALRDRLAEGWPSDRSAAAMAFLQRVNDMIDAMTQTALGAAEVRTNVSHIVAVIAELRADLAPLVAKYNAAASYPDPRVRRQTQKSLDELARQTFVRSDEVVAEATANLAVSLPNYDTIRDRVELESSGPGQISGNKPRTTGSGRGGGTHLTNLAPPTFDPPAPVDVHEIDDDFDLAAGRPFEPSSIPGGTHSDLKTGVPGVRDVAAISNGIIGGPLTVPAQSEARAPSARGPVIGMPPAGAAMPRAGAGGSQPAQRLSGAPVGGPMVRSHGAAGGNRDRSFEEYVARSQSQSDDESQWVVPRGVTPLIEATKERPHDVGPGVLGIDR